MNIINSISLDVQIYDSISSLSSIVNVQLKNLLSVQVDQSLSCVIFSWHLIVCNYFLDLLVRSFRACHSKQVNVFGWSFSDSSVAAFWVRLPISICKTNECHHELTNFNILSLMMLSQFSLRSVCLFIDARLHKLTVIKLLQLQRSITHKMAINKNKRKIPDEFESKWRLVIDA